MATVTYKLFSGPDERFARDAFDKAENVQAAEVSEDGTSVLLTVTTPPEEQEIVRQAAEAIQRSSRWG